MSTTEHELGRGGKMRSVAKPVEQARNALRNALATLSTQLNVACLKLSRERERPSAEAHISAISDLIALVQKAVKTTLDLDDRVAPDKALTDGISLNLDKARAEIGHRLARLAD